jgi:hypothetical protein
MREDLLKKAMREMGSRGGKRRLETMTPEERSAIAKKASQKAAEVRSKKAAAKSTKKSAKRTAKPARKGPAD